VRHILVVVTRIVSEREIGLIEDESHIIRIMEWGDLSSVKVLWWMEELRIRDDESDMDDHIVMMRLGHLLEKYEITRSSCLERYLMRSWLDEHPCHIPDIGMREDKIRYRWEDIAYGCDTVCVLRSITILSSSEILSTEHLRDDGVEPESIESLICGSDDDLHTRDDICYFYFSNSFWL
jgi:hypothetical protein